MRRLVFVAALVLLAAVLGGITSGMASTSASESVTVYWEIGGCWINLQVHPNVDLSDGVLRGFSPGDVIESDDNRIMVVTNCQGFTLQASIDSVTTPPGFVGNIYEDFYWRMRRWGTGEVLVPWQQIVGMDSSPVTIETTGNPATKIYNAGYKYILDEEDIEGYYSVVFNYTVTTP